MTDRKQSDKETVLAKYPDAFFKEVHNPDLYWGGLIVNGDGAELSDYCGNPAAAWQSAMSRLPVDPPEGQQGYFVDNLCEGCGEPVYLSGLGYTHTDTTLNVDCDARPRKIPAPEPERIEKEPALKTLARLLTEAGAIPVINGQRIEPLSKEVREAQGQSWLRANEGDPLAAQSAVVDLPENGEVPEAERLKAISELDEFIHPRSTHPSPATAYGRARSYALGRAIKLIRAERQLKAALAANATLREQLAACTTLASHSAPAWLRARAEKVDLRVKQAATEIVSTESACIEWGASPEQSVDTVVATIRKLLDNLAADAQLEERKK